MSSKFSGAGVEWFGEDMSTLSLTCCQGVASKISNFKKDNSPQMDKMGFCREFNGAGVE
jgi:hypothetical protein